MKFYVLNDKREVVETESVEEFGKFFEDPGRRRVASTPVGEDDKWWVSTIFLGLDHNLGMEGPPVVFETMVFPKGSWSEAACVRACTWDEALENHAMLVEEHKSK